MSARLQEFLTEESDIALTKVAIAINIQEQLRIETAVIYPGPAPEPMTLPPEPRPQAEIETKVIERKKGTLVRLPMDHRNAKPTVGETCPGCKENKLIWAIVLWPGAKRPPGGPEMTWWCRWCRQYYVEE